MSTYKNFIRVGFFCLFSFSFFSCGFFLVPPLEVITSTFDEKGVIIEFSRSPTSFSLKNGFSLTKDDENLTGQFYFYDNFVRFEPQKGIQKNFEYKLKLSSEIEDKKGISMLNDYYHTHSTRIEEVAPWVKSITPSDGTVFFDDNQKINHIEFTFSEGIDPASFDSNFRIEPSVDYVSTFSECGSIVQIVLLEELQFGKEYIIYLDTNLSDLYGNKMENPFVSSFSYGQDFISPDFDFFLLSKDDNEVLKIENQIDNVFIDDRFQIVFNEIVDIENLSAFISMEPDIPFSLDIDYQTKKSAKIFFDKNITWGKQYFLKINPGISDKAGNTSQKEKIFSLCFNNEKNRPVKFLKAYLKNGQNFHLFSLDNQYSSLSFDVVDFPTVVGSESVSTDLYLFFLVSKESEGINRFSAMEFIDLSGTNGCSDFFIKKITSFPSKEFFSQTDFPLQQIDQELFSYYENQENGKICILKCQVEITNNENKGLITLSINKDVSDTLGNTLNEEIICVVNKT